MHTKVKAILHIFATSVIPNAPHYHKLLHTSPIRSLRYFGIILMFLIVIFTLCIFFFVVSVDQTTQLRTSLTHALSSIPDNVQIRIDNGIMSTNLNRPLYIWSYDHLNRPSLIFLVDEHQTDRLNSKPVALLTLTKNHLILKTNEITYTKPYDTQTYIINSDSMSRFMRLVTLYAPQIQVAFYVSYFLVFPVLTAFWVSAIVIITSLCTYTVFHFFIKRVHFVRCIQATLHGSVLPFILSFFLLTLYPGQVSSLVITPFLVGIFSLVSVFEMYFDEIKNDR